MISQHNSLSFDSIDDFSQYMFYNNFGDEIVGSSINIEIIPFIIGCSGANSSIDMIILICVGVIFILLLIALMPMNGVRCPACLRRGQEV